MPTGSRILLTTNHLFFRINLISLVLFTLQQSTRTYNSKMAQSPNASLKYLRFLNLVEAIRGLTDFPQLDALEDHILHKFAAIWHVGDRLTVLEAMSVSSELSPTTVHRRLKSLRKKGVIQLINDEFDTRVKYVVPTTLTLRHFEKLGDCMDKASS